MQWGGGARTRQGHYLHGQSTAALLINWVFDNVMVKTILNHHPHSHVVAHGRPKAASHPQRQQAGSLITLDLRGQSRTAPPPEVFLVFDNVGLCVRAQLIGALQKMMGLELAPRQAEALVAVLDIDRDGAVPAHTAVIMFCGADSAGGSTDIIIGGRCTTCRVCRCQ